MKRDTPSWGECVCVVCESLCVVGVVFPNYNHIKYLILVARPVLRSCSASARLDFYVLLVPVVFITTAAVPPNS